MKGLGIRGEIGGTKNNVCVQATNSVNKVGVHIVSIMTNISPKMDHYIIHQE